MQALTTAPACVSPQVGRTSPCPQLPHRPAGAFYAIGAQNGTGAGAGAGAGAALHTFSGSHFFRYPQPVAVFLQRSADSTDVLGAPLLHSSYGARSGPTPSWTSPLALVRYPLYPIGLAVESAPLVDGAVSGASAVSGAGAVSDTPSVVTSPSAPSWAYASSWAGKTIWLPHRVLSITDLPTDAPPSSSSRASSPSRVHVHASRRAESSLARLLEVADGDLVEIEQWGGVLNADQCPPICGLFANVWRGTGVALRATAPFASMNKGTAIVEMLTVLGERPDGL